MINLFRKNDVVNIFLLLPYTILLRFYSLKYPVPYTFTESDTVVIKQFFDLIRSPFVQSILALLLVYVQAILINMIANNHRLHRQPSALTGMFYVLFASCIPSFQLLSPALIGMTFLLLATMNIFQTYNMNGAAKNIFNSALAASAATIIYMPYVFAILALFVGLAMIRNFKAYERIQFLIGYGVLFWICGSFLYFFDLLNFEFLETLSFPGSIHEISFSVPNTLWTLGILSILIVVSLLNYYNFLKKKGIEIRKKIDFFYWFMLCSVGALLFFQMIGYQHFYFVLVPVSLFISMIFLMINNKALAELFHFFLLIGIFYYQFG